MTGEVLTPDQELLDALQSPGDFAMPGNEGRGHGEKTAWELLADTRNEMVAMRHDFHEDIVILDQSITELSKAIRGNGGPGLQTTTLRLDDRIKRLEETLAGMVVTGTPASHVALIQIQERQTNMLARLQFLEDELRRKDRQTISRGWQLGLWTGTALIALLSMIISALIGLAHMK